MKNNYLDFSDHKISLPVFFSSISSIKTNLKTIEYLKLLVSTDYPHFLISAFDYYHFSKKEKERTINLLTEAKNKGKTIILDSGNYESYWDESKKWNKELFIKTIKELDFYVDIVFTYDEQNPNKSTDYIVNLIKERMLNQEKILDYTLSVPIIHAPKSLLLDSIKKTATCLEPIMIAIPERILGKGIIERAMMIKKISCKLSSIDKNIPIHLLGTGNPLSILIYIKSGAMSFDGLEWCKNSINQSNGLIYHFHQRDIFDFKTQDKFSYDLQTMVNNLKFIKNILSEIENSKNDIDKLLHEYLDPAFVNVLNDKLMEVKY